MKKWFLPAVLSLLVLTLTRPAGAQTSIDIGNPTPAGGATNVTGGTDVAGGGADIGGGGDQFQFFYQQRTGNFDVSVRLAGLSLTDAFAKAGLMARVSLANNSAFAATLATPSVAGSFLEARSATGGAAFTAGTFPVNYPYTWLRLQRVGNIFTGYASLDGINWTQLGTATFVSPTVLLGFAVSSHNSGQLATAQFRDYADTSNAGLANALPIEPLGPSSRRTGIAISEIMYKPAPRADGRDVEFIELFNSNPYFEDISGWKISGSADYTFPPGTLMPGGSFLVLAKIPADVQSVYGLSGVLGYGIPAYTTNVVMGVTNVVTNYNNNLPASGTVRLRNERDDIYLEVQYASDDPWPRAADGTGHSLSLARPSYGEGDPKAWAASDAIGGSPGRFDPYSGSSLRNVVINEFLAHSDAPFEDFIELYNHSNQEVDIGGCILTDAPHTNKYVFAVGTKIPARGYLALTQVQLGFGLNADGETIYLISPDRARFLQAIQYEGQGKNVSFGRFPDGAESFYPLTAQTPGAANAPILIDDIAINEIMYKPISGDSNDEYVELYNKAANPVNVGGWQFTAGINYTIPTDTIIPADGYLVVARSKTNLFARYANLNSGNTVGDYGGSLGNRGERLALARPETVVTTNNTGDFVTNGIHVVVDEVTYGFGGNWGGWANEGGSSLELIDPRANRRLAYNWADSDETAKAPWTTIQATGPMDNGAGSANFFEILALGEGEYLVDNVEVITAAGTNFLSAANSNFEGGQGAWIFRGTHIRSAIDTTGGFGGGRCLHVRASSRGDSIHNRCLVPIPVPGGTVTLRAQVRWLRGWHEILFRLHGNYMEATGPLLLPPNLGSPGARNSQAISNAPPAIYAVNHQPVVPAANQAVVVSARAHDVDGISSVSLRYRIDPAAAYTTVAMNDSGTGGDAIAGDGVLSATIPGHAANALLAFHVQATDGAASPATVTFPRGASPTTPECLVRFGDPVIASGFATYRQWMTANNFGTWQNRPALSNERLPCTLVYGNFRAIHFAAVKWAGSPYHQFGGDPNTTGHYSFDIPGDDLFLGTDNLNKIHAPGNGPFDDGYIQREQTCYWLARQLGLPWNYRRSINMFFNGNRPGGPNQLMEDTETPGNDVVESRFPDDPDGNLYKLQPWFEVDDGTARSLGFANHSWADLTRYTTTSNNVTIQKLARYRHNYLARAVKGSANDYADVFALKNAADMPAGAGYVATMESLCDMEQWMRTFAVHHSVGDWDHFGSRNSQNMYGYKSASGKWELMIWDMNIVIGNGSSGQGANLFETTGGGANMAKIFLEPTFRRSYFRALKELCTGAFMPANMNPMLDAKYAAYLASGVSPTPPQGIKDWIATARTSILGTVAAEDTGSFRITSGATLTVSNNLVTVTGEAPVDIKTIKINGVEYAPTWTSVKAWTIRVPVSAASNVLEFLSYDTRGNLVANSGTNIIVNFTGAVEAPQDKVVINEIMYQPAVPDAEFVELYNKSTSFTFDLSGWRFNGLDFTFPDGTVMPPRTFLVVARNRTAFATAYGASLPIAGVFAGDLQSDGETLTLIQPGATPAADVVISKVRYENRAPWPVGANSGGNSLQVVDPLQDNQRVANWSDLASWRFANVTATLATTNNARVILQLLTPGDVFVDDVYFVAGSAPEAGFNYVVNGDFEAPFPVNLGVTNFSVATNYSGSARVTDVKHNGSASLHMVSTLAGTALNRIIYQNFGNLPAAGVPFTLSYWYLPTTNTNNSVTVRIQGSAGLTTTVSTAPVPYTPGTNNFAVSAVLQPFPDLWLNEILPNNVSGLADTGGEFAPWLELYNGGTNVVSLAGLYLADNYTNLAQWPFPPGSEIQPGEFKVIFADAQPEQSTLAELHTSFRLNSATGAVALVRLQSGQPAVLDYVNYANVPADHSYGSHPDGQPYTRQQFFYTTPGGTNNPASAPLTVFINEWLAGNTGTGVNGILDANQPDDWFELYNPNDAAVNLAGYYLTDDFNDKFKYQIPAGYTIAAHGHLLVWADNETAQNTNTSPDLHVSFQLARGGEAIGLYAADGTAIDLVVFATQTNDLSMGRFPDGTANLIFMTNPTPRTANVGPPSDNTAPVLAAIGDKFLHLGQTLTFTASATDAQAPPQLLNYTLDPGAPDGASVGASDGQFTWTPSAGQLGLHQLTLRVTDTGAPALDDSETFAVTVLAAPRFGSLTRVGDLLTLQWATGPGRSYHLEYKDELSDALWQPLGASQTATGASLTLEVDLSAAPHRFIRLVAE